MTNLRSEFAATIGQWNYVRCECLVDMRTTGGIVDFKYECQACGNTNLRFIHTLQHTEDEKRSISVGLECARVLMEDDDVSQRTKQSEKNVGGDTIAIRAGALPPWATSLSGASYETDPRYS